MHQIRKSHQWCTEVARSCSQGFSNKKGHRFKMTMFFKSCTRARPLSLFFYFTLAGNLIGQEAAPNSEPAPPPPIPPTEVSTETLDRSIIEGVEIAQNSARTNAQIVGIADRTDTMLQEYRLVIRELEAVTTYNNQMMEIINSQEVEIATIENDLAQLQATRREIIPLLLRMIETLDEFISRDTPFLLDERRGRVADLRQLMDRGDVSLAEKFRNVFEAYQLENDFSRNIEAYQAEIALSGVDMTVEFFRFGRVGLYFQTLDGQTTGWWNPDSRNYEVLEGDVYRVSIGQALKIAKNQAPKNLLSLPIPAPKPAN